MYLRDRTVCTEFSNSGPHSKLIPIYLILCVLPMSVPVVSRYSGRVITSQKPETCTLVWLETTRCQWFAENGWKAWRSQAPTGNQSILRKTIRLLLNQRRREREPQSSWASPRAWKRFPRLRRRLVDEYDCVRAGFRVWDCRDYGRNIADMNHARSHIGTRASIQMRVDDPSSRLPGGLSKVRPSQIS